MEKIKKFKGGSLNNTCLYKDRGNYFVRKQVSLSKNREYGFYRWYSQLKRQQRYSILFPRFWPWIFRYGAIEDSAYLDMEYIDNSVPGNEYILNASKNIFIKDIFRQLINKSNKMYEKEKRFINNAINLYIKEEIQTKINHVKTNNKFIEFSKYKTIVFNGKEINSFIYKIDEYKRLFNKFYGETLKDECLTHGNLTLENTIYSLNDNNLYFIDPYVENIIDSKLIDYSQVLQSCNSFYEIYNNNNTFISDNIILNLGLLNIDKKKNDNMNFFNDIFNDWLINNLTEQEYYCVKLFEISQFIRMLPFKMEIDENKMIFFYSLASYLFDKFEKDIK